MFIFLALYFKYSTNGYFIFTEVVFIRDESNHRSASATKLTEYTYNSSRR
jgi:hypothetical protein